MATPSVKSPAMEEFLTSLFGDRTIAIKENKCVSCSGAASEFRDELSEEEFTISGLCQFCQDTVF